MLTAIAILLVVHGLIHLLGVAKAFGLVELQHLTPISPFLGLWWLLAAILFVTAGVTVFVWPRGWWALGAGAVVISMFAIVPSWKDAKFGAFANMIVLVAVGFGFFAQGPFSLRAEYEHDVASRLSDALVVELITEADIAHLPSAVKRYLREAGVVGRARVRNFRARIHGRIRAGRADRWMPLTAEQYNFVDPPTRLFYLNSSMFAIPVQGYHRYAESEATMRVRRAAPEGRLEEVQDTGRLLNSPTPRPQL